VEKRQRCFFIILSILVICTLIFAIGFFLRNAAGRAEAAPTPNPLTSPEKPRSSDFQPNPVVVASLPSPSAVKSYVISQARIHGINPVKADFIISHESQYGQRVIGDSGKSIGPWQFNLEANPTISRDCVLDLKCSTHLAFQWIADGKINAWSVWRMRHKWYEDAPD
jgi:hypothetical protein